MPTRRVDIAHHSDSFGGPGLLSRASEVSVVLGVNSSIVGPSDEAQMGPVLSSVRLRLTVDTGLLVLEDGYLEVGSVSNNLDIHGSQVELEREAVLIRTS